MKTDIQLKADVTIRPPTWVIGDTNPMGFQAYLSAARKHAAIARSPATSRRP